MIILAAILISLTLVAADLVTMAGLDYKADQYAEKYAEKRFSDRRN